MSGESDFVMKEVTKEYVEEFNDLLRYVFQVTNQDIFESGYDEEELLKAKMPILEHAFVLGWFDEDELISQLSVYPCHVNIHGKIFKMGGLTGVGTYPEYANQGLMGRLIEKALLHMKEEKQVISYLFPYSIPYYRKKGWEIINDRIKFTLKDSQFPKHTEVSGYVERHEVDNPDIKKVYAQFSLSNNGALLREDFEWDEYWRWENEEEWTGACYYNEDDEPRGYFFYYIEEDTFHIKEIIYLDQEARRGLWNFITAHLSMVDEVKGNVFTNEPIAFLLEDSQIEEIIKPYYMARVVDVKEFLYQYPYVKPYDKPISFIIDDPLAKWNNGVFTLNWQDNELFITDTVEEIQYTMNIQTFTSLFMSYRSPGYFYQIERIIADKKHIQILEDILPNQQPYFSDYF